MTHTVGGLLLAAGAAVIVFDLVVASSPGHRSTSIRLRLQRTLPQLSQGLLVVALCAAGAAILVVGLDLLSRT